MSKVKVKKLSKKGIVIILLIVVVGLVSSALIIKSIPTEEQKEVTLKAESMMPYLNSMGLGYTEDMLRNVLSENKYSEEAIDYAMKHVKISWEGQAIVQAQVFLSEKEPKDLNTREQMVELLEAWGFTTEQSEYAAGRCSGTWNEHATAGAVEEGEEEEVEESVDAGKDDKEESADEGKKEE